MDYEWVFDFPVPAGFVRYRNLVYFYYKYEGLMDYENAADFLKEFGIGEELSGLYAAMEESFQSWVHGDGTQGYMGNYKQRLVTLEELKAQEKEPGSGQRADQPASGRGGGAQYSGEKGSGDSAPYQ